jgi:hypothetical protein
MPGVNIIGTCVKAPVPGYTSVSVSVSATNSDSGTSVSEYGGAPAITTSFTASGSGEGSGVFSIIGCQVIPKIDGQSTMCQVCCGGTITSGGNCSTSRCGGGSGTYINTETDSSGGSSTQTYNGSGNGASYTITTDPDRPGFGITVNGATPIGVGGYLGVSAATPIKISAGSWTATTTSEYSTVYKYFASPSSPGENNGYSYSTSSSGYTKTESIDPSISSNSTTTSSYYYGGPANNTSTTTTLTIICLGGIKTTTQSIYINTFVHQNSTDSHYVAGSTNSTYSTTGTLTIT